MLPQGFPGMLPGLPGMLPGGVPGPPQVPAGMDPMAALQLQQAQAQAAHMEMVKQAYAEAAAKGLPEPTILPPGGLPRPGGHIGPGMMGGLPGMVGMAGMMGMAGLMSGMPGGGGPLGGASGSAAAPSSGSSGSGNDGTLEGAAKDFMRRNMLPPSFQEKLVRQLERKGDNWQEELARLDAELVEAGIPPILRPQFLLVKFGDIVPQTWTDYDDAAPKRQEGGSTAPLPERQQRPVRPDGIAAARQARANARSRSRRRSRSRDKGKKDRSRSRQKKSRSRSRKRDKER